MWKGTKQEGWIDSSTKRSPDLWKISNREFVGTKESKMPSNFLCDIHPFLKRFGLVLMSLSNCLDNQSGSMMMRMSFSC